MIPAATVCGAGWALTASVFYDAAKIAILPMGFCYPGTGKSGDLPPRPECAEHWRQPLLDFLPNIALTLVIGQYAHAWHLGERQKGSLTETVKNWKEYWPDILALPHPSPRNNMWLRRNPWFEEEILPVLRDRVAQLLKTKNSVAGLFLDEDFDFDFSCIEEVENDLEAVAKLQGLLQADAGAGALRWGAWARAFPDQAQWLSAADRHSGCFPAVGLRCKCRSAPPQVHHARFP